MVHPSANAARVASSTARLLSTGSAPGRARHTGQTFVLGGAPKSVEHEQNTFVRVLSCTWTSRPTTISYFSVTFGSAVAVVTGVPRHRARAREHTPPRRGPPPGSAAPAVVRRRGARPRDRPGSTSPA